MNWRNLLIICGGVALGAIILFTAENYTNVVEMLGASCTSEPNICGEVNTGAVLFGGSCTAHTPEPPKGYRDVCEACNSAGECNSGSIQCDGSCSATAPNEPAPEPPSNGNGNGDNGRGGDPGDGGGATFKRFGVDGFVRLWYNTPKAGATRLQAAPPITGDTAADNHIQEMARKRNYELQWSPTIELSQVGGEWIQSRIVDNWNALERDAERAGYNLYIVSGYRSIQDQRNIFLSRLQHQGKERIGREYTDEEIASGEADAAIREILETSSIPGFSRHHSGYSVDIHDANSNLPFERFGETEAYNWISQNNFLNAKRHGFIPAYPQGAEIIGPVPEPWEYVYVGREHLVE